MSIRICGGLYGSMRIESPASRVRPTTDRVKEAIFSILVHDLEGAMVLDLFAGSGSLGIEAISRGAGHVTFVEKSLECIKVIEQNVRTIGVQELATIIKSDAVTYVKNCMTSFNLIFMDPPPGAGRDGSGPVWTLSIRARASISQRAGSHVRDHTAHQGSTCRRYRGNLTPGACACSAPSRGTANGTPQWRGSRAAPLGVASQRSRGGRRTPAHRS